MRAAARTGLLACLAILALPAAADCPPVRGDLAPGELNTALDPDRWTVQGDGFLGIGDVIALLRAAVGLQEIRFDMPGPACQETPGDFAPGVLDNTTIPPTWRPDPNGMIDVGDVVALQRAVVNLQQLGAGLTECAHELRADWDSGEPRSLTDRRCPVGLSADVLMTVIAYDAQNDEQFVIDGYTVTYSNLSRGGADEVGVDVPPPIDAILFLDPDTPTYMQVERLSILDEAAKTIAPLNEDFFYAQGDVLLEATIGIFGRAVDRPDGECFVSFTHRFLVEDSGAGTNPETDPDCIAESEAEGN